MDEFKEVFKIAQSMNYELLNMGVTTLTSKESTNQYDIIVTNKALRKKTEKLFKDGHHARAVEEAYKLIDNLVKNKAGLQSTDLTGSKLMQNVFSQNKPLLKLNEGATSSEQNEQTGYMQILSGCMTGIRNPRAHESDWEDTEQRAIELLTFANHLIERIYLSEKTDNVL